MAMTISEGPLSCFGVALNAIAVGSEDGSGTALMASGSKVGSTSATTTGILRTGLFSAGCISGAVTVHGLSLDMTGRDPPSHLPLLQ